MSNIVDFFLSYRLNSGYLAILRIIVFGYFLTHLISNFKIYFDFSKSNGICPLQEYKHYYDLEERKHRYNFFSLIGENPIYHKIFFYFILLFCFFSFLGFLTNISILLFLLLYISLQNRVWIAMETAGYQLSRLLIFAFIFIDCGYSYSIDSLIFNYNFQYEMISSPTIRCLQIILCYMYFMTAIQKLKNEYWKNGSIIKKILMCPIFYKKNKITSFIRNNNLISKSIAYLIICYQLMFPFLIWNDDIRNYYIALGLIIHLGMAITIELSYFAPVTILCLLLFFKH